MTTKQQGGGTVKNSLGQDVELGRPHQPNPGERKHEKQQDAEIDMNPGEPARPYVGGEEPQPAGTKAKKGR